MGLQTGRAVGRPKAFSSEGRDDHSDSGVPAVPTGLKAAGKADWYRIWEAGTWLDREKHYLLVRNYCQKVDELAQWQRELKGFPMSSYQQSNGAWAPYPQVRLIQEGRAQLVAWLSELQLTPSQMPEQSNEDEILAKMTTQNRG